MAEETKVVKFSEKAQEAIHEAAELIANCYCDEEDTFSLEKARLEKGIVVLVDFPEPTKQSDEGEKKMVNEVKDTVASAVVEMKPTFDMNAFLEAKDESLTEANLEGKANQ